jgi:hypothetical protein
VHPNPPAGLFALAWGVVAAALGLMLVTNFRGFRENFADRIKARMVSPHRHVRLVAVAAGVVFTIAGAASAIGGVVVTVRSGMASTTGTPLPSPFRYLFIAMAVAIIAWYWLSPAGPYRAAARHGSWRLPLAVVASAGTLTFGVAIAIGQWTIAFVALAVAGLPTLLLLTNDKPRS